ncbi:efflux transporter, RND family, MFP subunit [Afipia carboxidovorans OM5]|uniref:HlyD family protein n=1 Tax=Afipia carboxidovorans (strain ATCC 49405 / DSM 1227 / KCTC 32145 / OM5) TaxID=504832 RepID=B6JDQ8_AFIC5|nr:efflux RND transporter periplasmic adaptor subunit [Afipia carboxidovorans]ACI91988.1 efflux transporter, RND family, MFP subunit [Afipia carboxidovorans OM5]AEI04155.1 HlyD family protein [Afipia carboxidovorans OM4]AEI07785.1 HlyD family protein [Afipia carboxidovorans OM5]
MKLPSLQRRTLMLIGVGIVTAALFGYVILRSGPLAPVAVTTAVVEARSISPALFGIGTVEAHFSYKIGPTIAGRVAKINVDVGERVRAGQILAEMDPVDLDARIAALDAAIGRTEASIKTAEAQVEDTLARKDFALAQAKRYEELWKTRAVSEVAVETKRQDSQVADAALSAARSNLLAAQQDLQRNRADREGLIKQRENLILSAPVDGVIAARKAEPGTTIVAGQAVIEMIDPKNLWINSRFDQIAATGLQQNLPASIALRSRAGKGVPGRVVRVEVLADAVTEENLAKVEFDTLPEPLPSIGELAEVTVALPELPTSPVIPNAAIQNVGGKLGVWKIEDGKTRFTIVQLGAADLEGVVQIKKGLTVGDRIVVYSASRLASASRIRVAGNPVELLK